MGSLLLSLSSGAIIGIIAGLALVLTIIVAVFLIGWKKCPADKIMVIYGLVGRNSDGSRRTFKCIHGGAAFVTPITQAYAFLDLNPILFSVDLKNAPSKQNTKVDVSANFSVAISTEPKVMQNAAERLLGLSVSEIQLLAKDITSEQLRLLVASMEVDEIRKDDDKFIEAVVRSVDKEINKIGLRIINLKITDVNV